MASQKSVSSKDKKLASKIIMKGVIFLSNLIPFIEKVGIFEIIKIEGISK